MNQDIHKRLIQWGEWIQDPRPPYDPTKSPFGRIQKEQFNAGARSDGIRYEVIDGVSCKPDGGLALLAEKMGRMIAHGIKCKETHSAVHDLTERMRQIVYLRYVVPRREKPRSLQAIADSLSLDKSTIHESLNAAAGRIERRIYGPYLVEVDEPQQ